MGSTGKAAATVGALLGLAAVAFVAATEFALYGGVSLGELPVILGSAAVGGGAFGVGIYGTAAAGAR